MTTQATKEYARTDHEQEALKAVAVNLASEYPQLIRALIEFRREKSSGRVEIHFSDGGIAKIFGLPQKTYK